MCEKIGQYLKYIVPQAVCSILCSNEWLRLYTNGGPARQMQGRALSGAVFFSSKVYTATCAASQRSNLRPQASAAPPLTRPCPRGVTQLARLAPIARTDRPREHSARQAYARHDEFQHEPHIAAEECDTCPAGNFAWVACKTAAEDRPSTPWWASHCRRRAGRAR